MNEKSKLDDFTKKLVAELPIEKPSIDFSKNIMSAIEKLEVVPMKNVYVPLISTKLWFVMIASVVGLIVYVTKNSVPSEAESYFSKLNFSSIKEYISFNVSLDFSISNIAVYGFLFFGIMLTIQIAFIKNHFDKRFE